MINLKPFLVALAAAVLAAAPTLAPAAQPGKGPNPKAQVREAVKGEFAQMVSELKLSDEQKAMLQERCKAKEEAEAKWDSANAERLRELREATRKAKAAGRAADPEKALHALEAERERATAAAAEAILAVLTAEQREAWEGVKLSAIALVRLKDCNLTEEQISRVKIACREAAAAMATGKKAPALKDLHQKIDDTILTPEQRALAPKRPAGK